MVTVGSLCTGFGALDEAAAAVFGPARLAFVADVSPAAVALLAHRHPDVPNLGDIKAVDWAGVEPVDILTAGFPCQDISNAGGRAGLEGEKSALWFDVAAAVRALRPRVVVLENVAALLGRGMGRVVGDLASLGYVGSWACVRASDVGAPHRRDRVFIVAYDPEAVALLPTPTNKDRGHRGAAAHGGVMLPEAVALLPTPNAARVGSRLDTQVSGDGRETPNKLGWAVALLPTPNAALGRSTGFPSAETAAARFAEGRRFLDDAVALLPTPTARDQGRSPEAHLAMKARMAGGARTQITSLSVLAKTGLRQPLLPTPWASEGAKGGPNQRGSAGDLTLSSTVMRPEQWGDYAAAVGQWETVLGRPAPEPTELGPRGNRRLSARFVEWLMGCDEGWVCDVPGLSRNQQLHLLGNGVVKQQGAYGVALAGAGMTRPSHLDPSRSAPVCGPGGTGGTPC